LFKGQDSQKGIALLTVMVIMTVLVITGSLLLRMASSESRIIDDYGDNTRAFFVAEAGADLAIKQWRDYVASLPPLVNADGSFTGIEADRAIFLSQLGTSNNTFQQKIRGGYQLGSSSTIVSINFEADNSAGTLDITQSANTPYFLTLTVTGNYGGSSAEQKVRLCYYWNRTTESYKGDGTPAVNPPSPPAPGNFTPPITGDSWTNTDTGANDTRWDYDTTTNSVSRTFESGNFNSIYTNTVLTAPFSLNMYASFILSNNSNHWPGSEMRVGLGFIPVGNGGTSALAVALTIVEVGNSPKVSLTIRDGNNSNITVPVNFTRTLDANSKYQIQVSSQNNNLSINISDNTGQTFNYTSSTTLRPGRLILIDDTNSHADPRFTFPQ